LRYASIEPRFFIEALVSRKTPQITSAVHGIFLKTSPYDDYLLMARVKYLIGTGNDQELRDCCLRQISLKPRNSAEARERRDLADSYRQLLEEIDSANKNH